MTIVPDRESFEATVRERRCIVTHEALPETRLVRFVVDPQGNIVPDIAAKLPGRGMWVSARREVLEQALARRQFSKAAHAPVEVCGDLPLRVEKLLVARMSGDLGLARRSGQLMLGFDNVVRAFAGKVAPAALVEASDGAPDGRRKLLALTKTPGLFIIDCLTGAELSLAVGRENVVHAALKSGRISERLTADAGRLGGFRPAREFGLVPAEFEPAGNKGME
jgi:hypothetical protein